MPSKPWYASKTIWSDVVTVGMGVLMLVDQQFGTHITTSHYFAPILTFLGALGLYGRTTATTTIGGAQ